MKDTPFKKKPALDLVIEAGRSKSPMGDGDDATTDEDESSEDYSASVAEVFDAIKNGDKEAFEEAFKAAVMSCK